MQSCAILLLIATGMYISHLRVLWVFFMFSKLVDSVLEFDDFNGATEARPSSESLDFWQQIVVGGVLATEPDMSQSLLWFC